MPGRYWGLTHWKPWHDMRCSGPWVKTRACQTRVQVFFFFFKETNIYILHYSASNTCLKTMKRFRLLYLYSIFIIQFFFSILVRSISVKCSLSSWQYYLYHCSHVLIHIPVMFILDSVLQKMPGIYVIKYMVK